MRPRGTLVALVLLATGCAGGAYSQDAPEPTPTPSPTPEGPALDAGAPSVRLVSEPVVVAAGGSLTGAGSGRTVLRAAPGYTGKIVVTPDPVAHHRGITLRGFTVDCGGTAAMGVDLVAPDDLVVEDVEVTRCQALGDLEAAFRVRGLGGADLTHTVRLHQVDAHDNKGNGVHVGLGVRGIVMTEQTTDRNGKDGTVLDGSESRIDGLRSRGNGRAGVQFRNLLATQGSGIQAVGNLYGVRALSLVGADLQVVAQNNRRADVWFDPTLIGGCVGLTPGCQTNYGRTRAVRLSGVVGPTYTLSGYSPVAGSTPYLNPDPAQQVVDRSDLLTTA